MDRARDRDVTAGDDAVANAELRALLALWRAAAAAAGRATPRRADLLPEAMARWWPDLAVYDVVADEAGIRMRFRLQGERVANADGGTFTGRFLDETLPAAQVDGIMAGYCAVFAARAPVYAARHTHDRLGRAVVFERLIMPFGEADGPPAHMITALLVHAHGAYFERADIISHVGEPSAEYLVRAVLAGSH
jgi:hypothetical protein